MMQLPQPFEELDHTADVGVIVRGASAAETLARLVLTMSHLLSGGGALEARHELEIAVPGGDPLDMATDVLRELLFRFDCDHRIAAGCEVTRFDDEGATLKLALADYDEAAHEEGTELKAVTLHEARFERDGEGWVAQIVFDV
jgi:SHS2 domain-containing protein